MATAANVGCGLPNKCSQHLFYLLSNDAFIMTEVTLIRTCVVKADTACQGYLEDCLSKVGENISRSSCDAVGTGEHESPYVFRSRFRPLVTRLWRGAWKGQPWCLRKADLSTHDVSRPSMHRQQLSTVHTIYDGRCSPCTT